MHLSLIFLCVFSDVSEASITNTSRLSASDEAGFLLLCFLKCSQTIGVPMINFPAPRHIPIIKRRFLSQDIVLHHISCPQTKQCCFPSRRISLREYCIQGQLRSFCFFSPWQSRSFEDRYTRLYPIFCQRNQVRSHPRGILRLLSFHALAYARYSRGTDASVSCAPSDRYFP